MSSSSPIFERRDVQLQRQQRSCCCCCGGASSKVAPQDGSYPGYDMVEVRPNCSVRVRRINPVLRDREFDREMQIVMQQHKTRLKSQGLSLDNALTTGSHNNSQILKNHHVGSADSLETLDNQDDLLTIDESPREMEPGPLCHSPPEERNLQQRPTRTATSIDVNMDRHRTPQRKTSKESKPQRIPLNNTGGAARVSSDVPLFLIHGVGGSADVWQAQVEYFSAAGFEIIAPDLLGHGMSSAPDKASAYHFDAISQDLLLIFDKYCKPTNIVIGHSYGSSFAAVLCQHRGSRVKRMILISGGSPIPLAPQPGLFSLPACFLACCRPVLARGFNKSAFKDPSKSFIPSERAFDVPSYVLRHMMCGQLWPGGDADFHRRYVTCPTLLVHGEHDGLVSVADEHDMEEALENCVLFILPDASHMVMLEQPDKVNALIHEFISIDLGGGATQGTQPATRPPSARPSSVMSLRSVKSIPNNLLLSNLKT